MFGKLWKKCVNYETISYLVCGVLTTAVDFVSYTAFRKMSMGVGVSQALSWVAAVLFAYIVNKIIVFRNFNMGPAYLLKEGGAFFAARAISGVATWVLMVVMVKLGGDRGFVYEMFCKFQKRHCRLNLLCAAFVNYWDWTPLTLPTKANW